MPAAVLVGAGLPAMMSIIHCSPMGRAHGDVADFVLVAGEAHPVIGALAKHDGVALAIHLDDGGALGDVQRACGHRARYLVSFVKSSGPIRLHELWPRRAGGGGGGSVPGSGVTSDVSVAM